MPDTPFRSIYAPTSFNNGPYGAGRRTPQNDPYRGGFSPLTKLAGSSLRAALSYAPVLMLDGDSQALGTAATAEIASFKTNYAVTDQVKVLNAAGQFVTYDPNGGIAGVNPYTNNSGNPGIEIGFIRKFVAAYSSPLYIMKRGAPGSTMTRGLSNGSVTGGISGDNLTVTAGTPGNNFLLVGGGLPVGIYLPFVNNGSVWYARKLGSTATPGLGNVASTAYTTYIASNSWSVTEGALYLGTNNSITNQSRGVFTAALALITSPRIVTYMPVVGTNDMADVGLSGAFQADQAAALTRRTADFNLSQAQIILPRVGTGSPGSATVRAAQAANVSADTARRKIIDTDALTRHDGTHWNLAGLDFIGAAAFDLTVF